MLLTSFLFISCSLMSSGCGEKHGGRWTREEMKVLITYRGLKAFLFLCMCHRQAKTRLHLKIYTKNVVLFLILNFILQNLEMGERIKYTTLDSSTVGMMLSQQCQGRRELK